MTGHNSRADERVQLERDRLSTSMTCHPAPSDHPSRVGVPFDGVPE